MLKLLDFRAHDGSRKFAELPQTELWYTVRDHVQKLPGALLTGFLCDRVTEAWIDFEFRGHSFSINDQFGEYWFFVKDPACPDATLDEVVTHFQSLLRSSRSGA
jgi:hypothetical protein